ncbi:uncharacterized protein LOC131843039 [Achroia grisella]|uniref:uncharacterized protein LOC131843039 n=1 Tax=Achroia grisella TaxID=688607 RepID=UPI0027D245F9|nr:uncharacterized protein LOC131843039 [Achroia grisella]
MLLYLFFIVVTFVFSNFAEKFNCDYQFGDPTWNYSKVFHNKIYPLPKGSDSLTVHLKKSPGKMVNFVCVNITNADLKSTNVSFSAIFDRVSVVLKERAVWDLMVHVIAKQHGY